VLFPNGLVSPRNSSSSPAGATTCSSLAVRGTFDDCQAHGEAGLRIRRCASQFELSSANSINLGRCCRRRCTTPRQPRSSGAARRAAVVRDAERQSRQRRGLLWARHLGLPIGEVVLAHNANRPVTDYLGAATGSRAERRDARVGDGRRQSEQHGAPAGAVSGPIDCHTRRKCRPAASTMRDPRAHSRPIRRRYGQVWCPHTATAAEAWARLPEASGAKPLVHRRDRASGQVRRDRRAADRPRGRRAAGAACAVRPAVAFHRNRTRAAGAARRCSRAECRSSPSAATGS
jgi:threonine synthase